MMMISHSKREEILQKLVTSTPTDLEDIAKKNNILLGAKFMDDDSGRIYFDKDKDQYVIEYNLFHSSRRQRFTIAHEFGHFFLHKDELEDKKEIKDNGIYRSLLSTQQEIEANKFAADLLMPLEAVKNQIKLYKKKDKMIDIKELSNIFNVSRQAIKIRLGIPI